MLTNFCQKMSKGDNLEDTRLGYARDNIKINANEINQVNVLSINFSLKKESILL